MLSFISPSKEAEFLDQVLGSDGKGHETSFHVDPKIRSISAINNTLGKALNLTLHEDEWVRI